MYINMIVLVSLYFEISFIENNQKKCSQCDLIKYRNIIFFIGFSFIVIILIDDLPSKNVLITAKFQSQCYQ